LYIYLKAVDEIKKKKLFTNYLGIGGHVNSEEEPYTVSASKQDSGGFSEDEADADDSVLGTGTSFWDDDETALETLDHLWFPVSTGIFSIVVDPNPWLTLVLVKSTV
jgi:hypothetical protein